MTAPLFLAAPDALAGLEAGSTLTLAGDEARHAVTVQRLAPGEAVLVADGRGRGVAGTVAATHGGKGSPTLEVTVEAVLEEPTPSVRFVLVQALGKGGRDEMAVETATELGAHEVVPWQARRCVSVWKGEDRREKGRRRWQQVAEAAAKQSRRLSVPGVQEPVDTKALAKRIAAGEWDHVLVLHEAASTPVTQVALGRAPGGLGPASAALVVGPEGGISDEETELLRGAGPQVHVVRLGPHVLRTSTAGPVALAVLAARGW